MTLFECLKSFILADVNLAAALVGGVSPGVLPQNPSTPLCVTRYISGASEPPTFDGGPSPWSQTRIEFTFWGNDILVLEQCASLAAKAFTRSLPFYIGGSPNGLFCPYQIQGPRGPQQDTETRLYGIQIDIIGKLNGDTLA